MSQDCFTHVNPDGYDHGVIRNTNQKWKIHIERPEPPTETALPAQPGGQLWHPGSTGARPHADGEPIAPDRISRHEQSFPETQTRGSVGWALVRKWCCGGNDQEPHGGISLVGAKSESAECGGAARTTIMGYQTEYLSRTVRKRSLSRQRSLRRCETSMCA